MKITPANVAALQRLSTIVPVRRTRTAFDGFEIGETGINVHTLDSLVRRGLITVSRIYLHGVVSTDLTITPAGQAVIDGQGR